LRWSERDYVIAFNMLDGVGPKRLSALVKFFGSLEQAWHADCRDLIRVPGFGEVLARHIADQRREIDPNDEKGWAASHGARIITLLDSQEYPSCLKHLPNPPLALYVRGQLPDRLGIAIVGSRKATQTGKKQAYNFAYRLADCGIPIISGLAVGIDTQAHLGALAAQGFTAAVMATPINVIYPAHNRRLAQSIADSGCIVTEFSSRTGTKPGNFPLRNRLIAAFSQAILVVEAGQKSGTLSTVDAGLDLGRDIWAVPGDIGHPLRKGTHALIKQGAGLADSPDDLLAAFPQNSINLEINLDRDHEIVLKYYLQGYSPDKIVALTGIPIHEVQNAITMIELDGLSNSGREHRL